MIMAFKVLKIVCCSNNASYEKASQAGMVHNIDTGKYLQVFGLETAAANQASGLKSSECRRAVCFEL